MSKYLQLFLKYFLLVLVALIITWITQFVALYGHPSISRPGLNDICNTTAFYRPTPTPSHDSGLPIPYVTHYVADGGCGLGMPINLFIFMIDCLVWFLVIVGITRLIRYLAKR